MKPHSSIGESPFFLLYGRDTHLPTEMVLDGPPSVGELELDDYKTAMLIGFSTTWENAQVSVRDTQMRYKDQYDRSAKPHRFHVDD